MSLTKGQQDQLSLINKDAAKIASLLAKLDVSLRKFHAEIDCYETEKATEKASNKIMNAVANTLAASDLLFLVDPEAELKT